MPQNKEVHKEYMRRYRELQGRADGITDDQRDRFPKLILPFGPAYYKALDKQT